MKEAGAQLGYGKYADAITKNPSGSYSVSDPDARAAIMKLRDDPDAASSMAAVLTQSNSFKLTGKIGRRPTDAELYMAHFMGVGGAGKLIQNAEDNPNASAARMFPNAAAANQSIFYDRSGQARSVSQVYSVLNTRYDGRRQLAGDAHRDGGCRRRSAEARHGREQRRAGDDGDRQRRLSLELPGSAQRDAGGGNVARRRLAQPEPIFRSLFQAGERTQPISPAVQELWGGIVADSVAPAPTGIRLRSARPAGSISSATATARSAADMQRHVRSRTLMVRSRHRVRASRGPMTGFAASRTMRPE